MCWTPLQLYKLCESHVAGHLQLDGCWKERNTLSWCEKHPLRCLTPDVTLSFSHTHTATWSSTPKNPNHSHSPSPCSTSEVNVPFDFLDRLTETFVCLFVFWLAISRLGFPMMIMTCMIGMCYLLATHIGLGWNMWVRAGGREREILGPVEAFSSAPRWKWPRLGQFTGTAWSHVAATALKAGGVFSLFKHIWALTNNQLFSWNFWEDPQPLLQLSIEPFLF